MTISEGAMPQYGSGGTETSGKFWRRVERFGKCDGHPEWELDWKVVLRSWNYVLNNKEKFSDSLTSRKRCVEFSHVVFFLEVIIVLHLLKLVHNDPISLQKKVECHKNEQHSICLFSSLPPAYSRFQIDRFIQLSQNLVPSFWQVWEIDGNGMREN